MLKYQVVESAFYGTSLTRKYTFAKLHGYSKDFKEFSVFWYNNIPTSVYIYYTFNA